LENLLNNSSFFIVNFMYKILFLLILAPAVATAQPKTSPRIKPHTATTTRQSSPHDAAVPAENTGPTDISVVADAERTADIMPAFTGGSGEWMKFLEKNLNASNVASAQDSLSWAKYGGTQKVIVSFIVCEDGSLCNYEVKNKGSISAAAAAEALRVMHKSPKWIPGIKEGKKVKVHYYQPIVFKFED
jgi:protein TonB